MRTEARKLILFILSILLKQVLRNEHSRPIERASVLANDARR